MKRSKWILLMLVVALVGYFVFLRPQKPEAEVVEAKKLSVKVMTINTRTNQETMNFIGIIQPKDLNQATFATIGTIEAIYVKEGETVKKDQALAKIDSEQAEISRDNANESLRLAKAQQTEAQADLRVSEAEYDAVIKDREAQDAVIKDREAQDVVIEEKRVLAEAKRTEADQAQVDYNQAVLDHGEDSVEAATALTVLTQANTEAAQAEADYRLERDTEFSSEIEIAQARVDAAKANLEAANSQVNISQNNVDAANENIEANILRSAINGTVVKLVSKVGDIGSPLAPTVIVASHEMVVHIGVSQGSVNDIKANQKTFITIDEDEYDGSVLDVAKLPDTNSRTYLTRIQFKNNSQLNIGETASVAIDVGLREGVWLNLSTILNDGEDYVYIIQNNRVTKRKITILSINNNQVLISGLNVNDQLVIEGGRFLSVGSEVNITEIIPYE